MLETLGQSRRLASGHIKECLLFWLFIPVFDRYQLFDVNVFNVLTSRKTLLIKIFGLFILVFDRYQLSSTFFSVLTENSSIKNKFYKSLGRKISCNSLMLLLLQKIWRKTVLKWHLLSVRFVAVFPRNYDSTLLFFWKPLFLGYLPNDSMYISFSWEKIESECMLELT